jgi:hypothetical protein
MVSVAKPPQLARARDIRRTTGLTAFFPQALVARLMMRLSGLPHALDFGLRRICVQKGAAAHASVVFGLVPRLVLWPRRSDPRAPSRAARTLLAVLIRREAGWPVAMPTCGTPPAPTRAITGACPLPWVLDRAGTSAKHLVPVWSPWRESAVELRGHASDAARPECRRATGGCRCRKR